MRLSSLWAPGGKDVVPRLSSVGGGRGPETLKNNICIVKFIFCFYYQFFLETVDASMELNNKI